MSTGLLTSVGYKADAIANEFLSIPAAKNQLSQMKLQKLVYYAHGWHLALRDAPLVTEAVQAWKYGPVFLSLYLEFRDFGNQPITRLAEDVEVSGEQFFWTEPRIGDEDTFSKALVQRVWDLVGSYTAVQLSTLTHQTGTPWHQISTKSGAGVMRSVEIPNRLIRDYFRAQLKL